MAVGLKINKKKLDKIDKFLIKKLKTVNHNIHAVLVDLEDDKSEMLVAISVLQDKSRFRLIKN